MDGPTERFAALVREHGERLPLDEAAMLVAAHALPDLDVDAQLARLDALAAEVGDATPLGVCDHLVGVAGFAGDRSTYHDARNSLLPEVLDRRLGIPLTLSVVAIEVGRRRGAPLVGIGMPGHFLVRPADEVGTYVDVYDGARVLDREGCREIFDRLHTGGTWRDDLLAPVESVAIVTRLLANLANAHRRVGDRRALSWTLELRLLLPGATIREQRELAVVLGAAGRYARAAEILEGTGEAKDLASAQRMRARLN